MLSRVIIVGTDIVCILLVGTVVIGSFYLVADATWQAYSDAPSGFHWIFGVLGIVISWIKAWNWAEYIGIA